MYSLIQGAGIFIYPLALCSLSSLFILVERIYALRRSQIIPSYLWPMILRGERPSPELAQQSVGGRIAEFFYTHSPDPEALKAFARLELAHLERGFYILDLIVAAAPLMGLLGTVSGLIKVFGNVSTATGVAHPEAFVGGIALALSTTVLGLSIAIPTLIGASYLQRRVDLYSAELEVEIERLVQLSGNSIDISKSAPLKTSAELTVAKAH